MRVSKVVLALASMFALGATGVAAQVPGISLDIVPKIGAEMPLSDLPTTPSAGAVASLNGTLALGVAAELGLPGLPFSLRANVDATTKKSISATGSVTSGSVDQTMMTIFGDLVFRPLPKLILVQPYLMGGLGVKRYNYSLSDVTNPTTFQSSFTDRKDLAYHLGVGLDIALGSLALVAEVNDYMNQYQFDSGSTKKFQHDLFIMAGLRLGLF
jgi:opacity protein-like surface antigen